MDFASFAQNPHSLWLDSWRARVPSASDCPIFAVDSFANIVCLYKIYKPQEDFKFTMKIILAVIFAAACAGIAFGQSQKNVLHGTIEEENTTESGELEPRVKVFVSYGGKTNTGWYCWGQLSLAYSQAYCGVTHQPKNWLQFGVAVGVETAKKPLKGAGFVRVEKGKFSNLLVLEKGAGPLWYRNQADFKSGKHLTLSLASERYVGTGFRAEYAIPGSRFSVGGEYLFSSRTARFGAKYSF